MNEEQSEPQSILEEFSQLTIRRRQLLPWWIKGFSLLFMFSGTAAIVCLILGVFGNKVSLSMYGFDANDSFSVNGLIVISVFILKGIAAWSLWFEKDYAIFLGETDAVLGIILCLVSMFVLPYLQPDVKGSIRIELLLLFPYLIKLIKIKDQWLIAVEL